MVLFLHTGKNERGPYSSFGAQVRWRKKWNWCYWGEKLSLIWCFAFMWLTKSRVNISLRSALFCLYSKGSCLQTSWWPMLMPCLPQAWSLALSFTPRSPTTPGDAHQMETLVRKILILQNSELSNMKLWVRIQLTALWPFFVFQTTSQKRLGSHQDCHLL